MRISTTDPISLNDVADVDAAPYVTEGDGDNAIRVYFESEHNRQLYLSLEAHGACNTPGVKRIYDGIADNPDTGMIS